MGEDRVNASPLRSRDKNTDPTPTPVSNNAQRNSKARRDETPTTSGRARFYQPIPTLRECRMDPVFLRSKIPCLSTRIMLTLSTRGVRSHSKPNAWAAISVHVRMAATGWVTCQRGANTLDLHTRTGLNSRLAIATRTAAAGAHQFPLISTRLRGTAEDQSSWTAVPLRYPETGDHGPEENSTKGHQKGGTHQIGVQLPESSERHPKRTPDRPDRPDEAQGYPKGAQGRQMRPK